eukprot:GHVT01046259.1.p1 GENE.GHVT01046259.1~~GHVT01046259.1.p1  ORF type:complete len:444 (+),score=46.38 GHVT01046259.1:449-1780(+)
MRHLKWMSACYLLLCVALPLLALRRSTERRCLLWFAPKCLMRSLTAALFCAAVHLLLKEQAENGFATKEGSLVLFALLAALQVAKVSLIQCRCGLVRGVVACLGVCQLAVFQKDFSRVSGSQIGSTAKAQIWGLLPLLSIFLILGSMLIAMIFRVNKWICGGSVIFLPSPPRVLSAGATSSGNGTVQITGGRETSVGRFSPKVVRIKKKVKFAGLLLLVNLLLAVAVVFAATVRRALASISSQAWTVGRQPRPDFLDAYPNLQKLQQEIPFPPHGGVRHSREGVRLSKGGGRHRFGEVHRPAGSILMPTAVSAASAPEPALATAGFGDSTEAELFTCTGSALGWAVAVTMALALIAPSVSLYGASHFAGLLDSWNWMNRATGMVLKTPDIDMDDKGKNSQEALQAALSECDSFDVPRPDAIFDSCTPAPEGASQTQIEWLERT